MAFLLPKHHHQSSMGGLWWALTHFLVPVHKVEGLCSPPCFSLGTEAEAPEEPRRVKLAPFKVCILLVPLPGRLLLSPRGSWDRWRGVPDELFWSPNPREQRLWQLSSHKSCHGCAQHSPGTICKAEGWRWGQGSAPSVPPWTFSLVVWVSSNLSPPSPW